MRAVIASQQMALSSPGQVIAMLLAVSSLLATYPARAQQTPPAAPAAKVSAEKSEPEQQGQPPTTAVTDTRQEAARSDAESENQDPSMDTTLAPRAIYNQALRLREKRPGSSRTLLESARREAGSDGELRYCTLYNLGWVEVNRADAALQADPQQALRHLHQSANRFRESIRVRPDSEEARQNLEIISQRILELTDSLEEKDPRELAARLDEMIARMREHQTELQVLLQEVSGNKINSGVDNYRDDYRRLAVTQRQLISEIQLLTDDARTQLDAAEKKPEEEQTPEQKMRSVQLGNMLGFIESGTQRMNKLAQPDSPPAGQGSLSPMVVRFGRHETRA